ncbi:NAD(P)H-dependent oxidoreductase [Zooshikella harenae]|uniref:NAD(P)H-dependent oxidoreductase n=1 Tax=Zooshikella harenae TaxID=2827238 RepID=A0ABS5ZH20_9GAMM|nr:NAD(P)H-dependent oxidoreductase [Zooshikella harenae]MBU2712576.1 NAD(P)H-dependent oxidoreductase [Zooshikella harenae]
MLKVLIINGAEQRKMAPGKFNESMIETTQNSLTSYTEVRVTHAASHYDIKEEQEKIIWADIIIFQFPVYWFNVPSSLKKFFDNVYEYGLFFGPSEHYGEGGYLTDKFYMLSTTWNAPIDAFSHTHGLFSKKHPDDLLLAIHTTQQYIGMQPLPSFSAFNIVKQPNFSHWQKQWQAHLTQYINSSLLNTRIQNNSL